MAETTAQDILRQEYTEVNTNFRTLADIRFKLLAFVPTLGAIAVFVLSKIVASPPSTSGGTPSPPSQLDYSMALLLGAMGFLVTLGITIYDQRNNELYGALVRRAKYLEETLHLPPDPKVSDAEQQFRGQFSERPLRGRYLFGLMLLGHDRGLALIYGTALGAWFFPIVYAGSQLLKWRGHLSERNYSPDPGHSPEIALLVACVITLAFIVEFFRLDSNWQRFSWVKWLWLTGDDGDLS